MNMSVFEKDVLRRLATEYMEYALLPIQKEKILLWKSLNRGKMQRPMVMIDQLPWNELNRNDELTLQVSDPFWRGIEDRLRKLLYQWRYFPVDLVLDPYIVIPRAIGYSGYGITPAVERLKEDATGDVYSQHFEVLIKDIEDVSKITDIRFTEDQAANRIHMQEAEEIFNGIAPVRLDGGWQFHLGVWDYLTQLMGVEQIYYDLIDRPELLHACMRRLTDATIAGIKQANELQLHNDMISTCHCSHIFTDELLPACSAGKGRNSENCWAFGLAQLFSSASPAITEEFEIPYISEMAAYFGMIYYGCCDRLDDRMELVKKIPHVRKVSCSPWSNRENFAAKIGPDLIMSNKPNPALLATDTLDEEAIKADLKRTCQAAKNNGVNLELIQKDVSTLRYQPERLTRWAQIAMEIVQNN